MSARRPRARLLLPFLNAHDAGLAQAAVDRDAPVGERLGDHVGSAVFLEAQFRVGMDVAADGGDGGRVGQDGFDQVHGSPVHSTASVYARLASPCEDARPGIAALTLA